MIKAEIDKIAIEKLTKYLNKIARSLTFESALRNSADKLLWEAKQNIQTQGQKYGRFKVLSPATKKARKRMGLRVRPILVVTGRLKNSFRAGFEKSKEAYIMNTAPYAKYHQTGTSKMPRRKILGTTKNSRGAISVIFQNYITDLLNGRYVK